MAQRGVATPQRLKTRGKGALKRLRGALDEALPAVAELERFEGVDRFGNFLIDGEETVDDVQEDLIGLLRMARKDHPGQRIEVVVIAHQGIDEKETT